MKYAAIVALGLIIAFAQEIHSKSETGYYLVDTLKNYIDGLHDEKYKLVDENRAEIKRIFEQHDSFDKGNMTQLDEELDKIKTSMEAVYSAAAAEAEKNKKNITDCLNEKNRESFTKGRDDIHAAFEQCLNNVKGEELKIRSKMSLEIEYFNHIIDNLHREAEKCVKDVQNILAAARAIGCLKVVKFKTIIANMNELEESKLDDVISELKVEITNSRVPLSNCRNNNKIDDLKKEASSVGEKVKKCIIDQPLPPSSTTPNPVG